MEREIEWSPDDYSASYVFTVKEDGSFGELKHILSMPSTWPESEVRPAEDYHKRYMETTGFEKYKKHRSWLGLKV